MAVFIDPKFKEQMNFVQLQNCGVVGCWGVDGNGNKTLNGKIFQPSKPDVTVSGTRPVPGTFTEKVNGLSATAKVLLAAAIIVVAFVVLKPFGN